eukprot:Rmarinus@m.26520
MNSIFRRFLPQGARYYTSGRQSEAKTRTVWGELSSLGWTFMVTYSICFQLRAFVGGVSKCEGPSMLPTLDNNVVIYERYSVRRWELHHGDVVLLRSPEKWKVSLRVERPILSLPSKVRTIAETIILFYVYGGRTNLESFLRGQTCLKRLLGVYGERTNLEGLLRVYGDRAYLKGPLSVGDRTNLEG